MFRRAKFRFSVIRKSKKKYYGKKFAFHWVIYRRTNRQFIHFGDLKKKKFNVFYCKTSYSSPHHPLYSRRKHYWYLKNTKWLWCRPIIHFRNIKLFAYRLILLLSFWYQLFAYFLGFSPQSYRYSIIAISIVVALSRS